MHGRLAVGGLVALLLVACDGGGAGDQSTQQSQGDAAAAPLRPDGPLRGIGLTGQAPDGASPIEPRLAFTTQNKQVTAVVALGRDIPEGSTLTVAWYRLAGGDEREHLFSHEIPVGPGGRGLSQGVSETGIAPGIYETVAKLGEWEVRTPWVVRVADPGAVASMPLEASNAVQVSAPQVGDESWNVPESGDSSWAEPADGDLPDAPPAADLDECTVNDITAGMDPMTEITVHASWIGACPERTLTATVSGGPQTLATDEPTEGPISLTHGSADVCELPGGSDMPGTVVRLAALGAAEGSYSVDYPLPDYGELLVAGLETRPEAGARVEGGDGIEVTALAMLMPPALGVEKLSVYAGDELVDSVGNASESSEPVPCDLGRYFAQLVTAYEVPADPPAALQICAEAAGFDGVKNRDCADFYTGEVWEGTFTYDFTGPGACSSRYAVKFTVSDGEIAGDATTVSNSCPGAVERDRITGSKQGDTLNLTFFGGAQDFPIMDGNRITGTWSSTPQEQRVLEVRCVSCGS